MADRRGNRDKGIVGAGVGKSKPGAPDGPAGPAGGYFLSGGGMTSGGNRQPTGASLSTQIFLSQSGTRRTTRRFRTFTSPQLSCSQPHLSPNSHDRQPQRGKQYSSHLQE